jgi:hypothetical protein
MHLLLNRTELQPERTFSDFLIDGVPYFKTIEDTVRPAGAKKVHGKTAIPAGHYKVILSLSNRFRRILPLLLDVPGFTGIRIHRGNTELDTDGCIIPGMRRVGETVVSSGVAEVLLVRKMKEALARGEEIFITITDPK